MSWVWWKRSGVIQITPQMRVLVAVEAADFRRGIDDLAQLCRTALESDPFTGTVSVFRNRRRTAIKLLYTAEVLAVPQTADARQPAYPKFSEHPGVDELRRAQIFSDALVPIGEPPAEENAALARAAMTFLRAGQAERVEPLEQFLEGHPGTVWGPSVLLNLGFVYLRSNRFSRAQATFEQVWEITKDLTDGPGRLLAERAVAELLQLHKTFGREPDLAGLLSEVEGRVFVTPAAQAVLRARHAQWGLIHRHHDALPSGTTALAQLLRHTRIGCFDDPRLAAFKATPDGAGLNQIRDLAQEVGLNLRMAHRSPGAELIFPAVMHIRGHHFSALLEPARGRIKLVDPILGGELWMTPRTLNEESTGYFLVPADKPLPPGWRAVDDDEGVAVRGKCLYPEPNFWVCPTGDCPPRGPSSPGMASYGLNRLLAGIYIVDTPVGHAPSVGPAVQFTVTYNQQAVSESGRMATSNLGAA